MGANLVPSVRNFSIESRTFGPGDHDIRDNCVGVGTHRLLRLDFLTNNIGNADFNLGRPVDHPEIFEFSGAHNHWHVRNFVGFDLLLPTGLEVVPGFKLGFCCEDVEQVSPGAGPRKFVCDSTGTSDEGVSPGWADVYGAGLPCQFVVIDGVADGDYQLVATTNARRLPEDNYADNSVRVKLHISGNTVTASPLPWVMPIARVAVASWDHDRLDIFGLGLDRAMYHKAWDGGAWRPSPTDWERLGGIFTSPPAVASWDHDRLDIFGLGLDRAMYHKAWDGGAWRPSPTDWERLGGVFTSPPAIASWDHDRLDIFGLGQDRAMYHKAWDGSAWRPSPTDWEGLGGVFISPPAVVSWDHDRLDIFGLGLDGAMYHKAWDGSAWLPSPTDWERLGGVFTSPPAVASWDHDRLDIFGLGLDGAMYHKAWDGSAWLPSPTDWERLGGVFIE